MADFRMPALGADMEKGTLVEWLVKPGDAVKRGDIIAVVDTEKGAIEIEVFETGVVSALKVPVGETVPVGAVLATIGAPGEAAPAPAAAPPKAAPPRPSPPAPTARAQAPAPAALRPGAEHPASPYARRRAEELGVALEGIVGSGPGGAVTARDVEAAAGTREKKVAKPGLDPAEMRRAIARAMSRAKREIPHYYVALTMDVGALSDWLAKRNAAAAPDARLLSVVPLMKAVALALRAVPQLNGWYQEDRFQPSEAVHMGAAVALRGGGLIAPAIHNVEQIDLDSLMAALRDLVARVRTGRLRSSEMVDGTITVTSLGEANADMVLPVIYPPQVAIVGFGAIVERPWVVEGKIEARATVTATVAADHRASDGRVGSRFLTTLAEILKEPEKL